MKKISMIVLITGVLLIKAPAYRLLSHQDNGFCDTIITLLILLHITTAVAICTYIVIKWDSYKLSYPNRLSKLL